MVTIRNVIFILLAIGSIITGTLGANAYFVKKSENIDNRIVGFEMIRMVATAPHDGKCEGAPQNIRTICHMLDILSNDLKGE